MSATSLAVNAAVADIVAANGETANQSIGDPGRIKYLRAKVIMEQTDVQWVTHACLAGHHRVRSMRDLQSFRYLPHDKLMNYLEIRIRDGRMLKLF
ncbi:MAG: hypothetical protein ABI882_12675 [Acidobacteriota bacterium]